MTNKINRPPKIIMFSTLFISIIVANGLAKPSYKFGLGFVVKCFYNQKGSVFIKPNLPLSNATMTPPSEVRSMASPAQSTPFPPP